MSPPGEFGDAGNPMPPACLQYDRQLMLISSVNQHNPRLVILICLVYGAEPWLRWGIVRRWSSRRPTSTPSPPVAFRCRRTTGHGCNRDSSTSASAGSTAPTSPCTCTNSPNAAATGASVASACCPATPRMAAALHAQDCLYSLVEKGAGEPTSAVIGSIVDYRHTAGRPAGHRRTARRSDGGDRVDDDHRGRLLLRRGDRLDVRPPRPRPRTTAAGGRRRDHDPQLRQPARQRRRRPASLARRRRLPAPKGWPCGSSRTARSRTRWSTASRR